VDKNGNIGKSSFIKHLHFSEDNVIALMIVDNYEKLLRVVQNINFDVTKRQTFLIDIPRAMKKENMNMFYSALETLKNGRACDDRYTFKSKWFEEPNIWVFTNIIPNLKFLSMDRWKIWTVEENEDKEKILVKIEIPEFRNNNIKTTVQQDINTLFA